MRVTDTTTRPAILTTAEVLRTSLAENARNFIFSSALFSYLVSNSERNSGSERDVVRTQEQSKYEEIK